MRNARSSRAGEARIIPSNVSSIPLARSAPVAARSLYHSVCVHRRLTPLAVAGALAAGPVVGAGVLVLSQLFKDQLQGLARVYYHVSGPWSAPVVERIAAPAGEAAPGAQADARTPGSQS